MYQRVIFGEVTHEENRRLTDLSLREWAVLVPVLVLIVWIGVYPTAFTGKTEATHRGAHRPGPEQGQRGARCDDPTSYPPPSPSVGLLPALIVLGAAAPRAAARPAAAARHARTTWAGSRWRGDRRPRCWWPWRAGAAEQRGVPRHGAARQLRALLRHGDLLRGGPGRAALDGLPPAAPAASPGEYYGLVLLRHRRHDADGLGRRPDRRVPRPGVMSLSLYVLAGLFKHAAGLRRGLA